MKHKTLPSIHRFCLKWNFDTVIFKPYIDSMKFYRYGKRRCDLTNKIGRQMGMQVHHILPKCLGGDSNKKNKVFLTKEEHVKAHMLFQRCLEDTGNLIFTMRHNH